MVVMIRRACSRRVTPPAKFPAALEVEHVPVVSQAKGVSDVVVPGSVVPGARVVVLSVVEVAGATVVVVGALGTPSVTSGEDAVAIVQLRLYSSLKLSLTS